MTEIVESLQRSNASHNITLSSTLVRCLAQDVLCALGTCVEAPSTLSKLDNVCSRPSFVNIFVILTELWVAASRKTHFVDTGLAADSFHKSVSMATTSLHLEGAVWVSPEHKTTVFKTDTGSTCCVPDWADTARARWHFSSVDH